MNFFKPSKKIGPRRIEYLDAYRGFVLSIMVVINFVLGFTQIPLWLKHAPPLQGLTIIDFGAPLFLFILGIFYAHSFEKRLESNGLSKTIRHFIIRYGIFWFFGFLGVLVTKADLTFGWNVLMAIGLSGLFALPFIFLPNWARLISGIALLLFYQFVILHFFQNTVLAFDMGGILGAISWTGLVLMGSFWWPLVKKNNNRQITGWGLGFTIFTFLAAFIFAQFYPANKPLVSASYILLSYGLGVLGLVLFHWLGRIKNISWNIITVMGKNALFVYMFSGILVLTLQAIFGPNLPGALAIFWGITIYFVTLAVAWWLDWRKIYIKL